MNRSSGRARRAAAAGLPGRARAGETPADIAASRALLARTPGIVWTADAELRCLFSSRLAAARLGLTAQQSIAHSCFADALGGTGPSPIDAHRRALGGETVSFELHRGGLELRCVVEPLRDADGRQLGVIGSAEDLAERRRTDQLAAERALLEAALNQTADGFAISDAQGRFVFVNSAAQQFAFTDARGSSLDDPAQVWGEWRDNSGPVSPDQWPVAKALNGIREPGREMYHDGPDGQRHHVLIAATPVRDAEGSVIGAVATSTNIDTQKANEERIRGLLARSLQMVNDIVNHSTAVIYLKDRDGRYVLINRHFEQLFGLKKESIQGHVDADFLPADTAAALRANDLRVLTTGEALQFEEVVPSDGEPHTYVSLKFPLRDDTGTIYGVCGISTDISERKRMEADLRQSQATLAAVIESSPDPIVSLDRQLGVAAINRVAARDFLAMFGREAVLGTRQADTVPEDFAVLWQSRLARALAGERFSFSESVMHDGVPRRFLISLTPTIQDGEVTGVTIFGKDITELAQSEEQARQHQAELAHVLRLHTMGEMAASLAHEVNQPLGAIANYAQGCRRRLEAGTADPLDLLQAIREIVREALRAGEITRRVRELLRKGEVQSRPVDVNDVVRRAVGMSVATASQHGVRVNVDLAANLPELCGDPIQLEQVVLNLLLNAIDATSAIPSARCVTVSTTASDAGVMVAVADNGTGIEPSVGKSIFEPFFTTKPGGLGMGLAISRSIIAAHGGRLSMAPADECGTVFRFTLPTSTDAA